MAAEGWNKKMRKPYTITKARDRWTEDEHERFLEALLMFERDWKRVEDFVGTKTAIQIRSHAQKYFLKVQKNGSLAHVPPPRPKRKAAHPCVQTSAIHDVPSVQDSLFCSISAYNSWEEDSSVAMGEAIPMPVLDYFTSLPEFEDFGNLDDADVSELGWACSINTPRPTCYAPDFGIPEAHYIDLAEVYSFFGCFVDPEINWPLGVYLQKLNRMDTMTIESVLLIARNLIRNLSSPYLDTLERTFSTYIEGTGSPPNQIQ